VVIVMEKHAPDEKIENVVAELIKRGFDVHRSTGSDQTVLGVVGDVATIDPREFEVMDGVQEAVRVSEPYKLSSRTFKRDKTLVKVNGCTIGGKDVIVMAGPCTIENEQQLFGTAEAVARAGAKVLRGGAYKPRTSPYAFQGMGIEGLKLLQAAGKQFGMATVSEVMEISQIEKMLEYVDILQIGARNMQNFGLLREAGQSRVPILLKRGLCATVDEWLMAAEYLLLAGGEQVVLCERGVRSFDAITRNLLDLSVIPLLAHLTHLPVIIDPSHGTGVARLVTPMALAGVTAGADGLLVEVHPDPAGAVSDGVQSLTFAQFGRLMEQMPAVAAAVGRRLPAASLAA